MEESIVHQGPRSCTKEEGWESGVGEFSDFRPRTSDLFFSCPLFLANGEWVIATRRHYRVEDDMTTRAQKTQKRGRTMDGKGNEHKRNVPSQRRPGFAGLRPAGMTTRAQKSQKGAWREAGSEWEKRDGHKEAQKVTKRMKGLSEQRNEGFFNLPYFS